MARKARMLLTQKIAVYQKWLLPFVKGHLYRKGEAAGFVMSVSEAAAWADVVMMLTRTVQADIYSDEIAAHIRPGWQCLYPRPECTFNLIEPRSDIDVFMVAPKGPGHTVRANI